MVIDKTMNRTVNTYEMECTKAYKIIHNRFSENPTVIEIPLGTKALVHELADPQPHEYKYGISILLPTPLEYLTNDISSYKSNWSCKLWGE